VSLFRPETLRAGGKSLQDRFQRSIRIECLDIFLGQIDKTTVVFFAGTGTIIGIVENLSAFNPDEPFPRELRLNMLHLASFLRKKMPFADPQLKNAPIKLRLLGAAKFLIFEDNYLKQAHAWQPKLWRLNSLP
jgi:hypothetical protein